MLSGTYSISKAFDLLLEYEMATGLKNNFKKSKDFFCCKSRTSTFTSDVLKQFKWRSDFIDILNIPVEQPERVLEIL